ncbi:MAG: ATP synthase F0 subunit B [Acidobacteria bacterium]|nr:ATP synthase F0 subunit B [Acidobacteriota bacterium]
MEPLAALGEILLKSIPTFILVWILYGYAVRIFYRPLQSTLQKRYEATGRLREQAETSITLAERKANDYQEALRAAWTEVFRQQEEERQKAMERRAEILRHARQQADQRLREAQQQLQQEVHEAKAGLAKESEQIARSILETILKPAAASPSSAFRGGSEVPG